MKTVLTSERGLHLKTTKNARHLTNLDALGALRFEHSGIQVHGDLKQLLQRRKEGQRNEHRWEHAAHSEQPQDIALGDPRGYFQIPSCMPKFSNGIINFFSLVKQSV